MTSVKCFSNWLKEAGRGHFVALFGWISFLIYGILLVTRLSLDTTHTFFGIGNDDLIFLSAGIGLLFSFLEFFYLFQQKKQDFYYSLPVKKSVIFWSRYIHGIVHFFIPLLLVMSVCGIWQTMIDSEFAPFVGSYTAKSVLAFTLIFLLFYHIGIASVSICGNFVSAMLICISIVSYFGILIENVIIVFAKHYFATYYRIEFLEKLKNFLSPFDIARELAGIGIYDKYMIVRYPLPKISIIVTILWIGSLFVCFFFAQKKRNAERTGNVFVFCIAERIVQIFFSVLAGAWFSAFVTEMTKKTGLLSCMIGAVAAVMASIAVHSMIEWIVKRQGCHLLRRKGQLILSGVVSVCIGAVMMLGASSYDSYIPKEAKAVSVVIEGLGMDHDEYELLGGRENVVLDQFLKRYRMLGKGRDAALDWAGKLAKSMKDSIGSATDEKNENREISAESSTEQSLEQSGKIVDESRNAVVTRATVCYETKGGNRHYRTYPVTEKQLRQFASVYETEEYKTLAYEGVLLEKVEKDRFTWKNGIFSENMKLDTTQKEAIINAYKEDVMAFQMERLTEMLPCGIIEVTSALSGNDAELIVYPFFEKTCSILKSCGIDVERSLTDYPVESIEVRETYAAQKGVSGGSYFHFYEEPQEVEQWKKKLVPKALDVQQVLYPLDRSKSIEAVVTDKETASYVKIKCVQRR